MDYEHIKEELLHLMKQRIFILDGGMATEIQGLNLKESHFRGEEFKDHHKDLKGNYDLLALTQPNIVRKIHEDYLISGADIIETNTFNSNSVSQSTFGTEKLAYRLNKTAAELARKVSDDYTLKDPSKPRFVAGSIGPTNKIATLLPIAECNSEDCNVVEFENLVEAYKEQVDGLIDGGVHILFVETVFATLNYKAALSAIKEIFKKRNIKVPIMVSGAAINASLDYITEIVLSSVADCSPLCVGVNCGSSTEIRTFVERVSDSKCFIHCCPSAGLPNINGEYDESPEFVALVMKRLAEDGLVNVVGGCCGTSPAYTKVISQSVAGIPPRRIIE